MDSGTSRRSVLFELPDRPGRSSSEASRIGQRGIPAKSWSGPACSQTWFRKSCTTSPRTLFCLGPEPSRWPASLEGPPNSLILRFARPAFVAIRMEMSLQLRLHGQLDHHMANRSVTVGTSKARMPLPPVRISAQLTEGVCEPRPQPRSRSLASLQQDGTILGRNHGEVREWLNRAVSKTVEPSRAPWVRIPPSPPR